MMQVGLLWYDSGSSELPLKILQAAKRYRERFGADPNVCYVHPATLPAGEQRIGDILVRPSNRILRHHLWIGQEQPPADVISTQSSRSNPT